MSYKEELTATLDKKTEEIVKELPIFANLFFRELKLERKSPRTRLQYAYDLRMFFNYLKEQSGFKNENFRTLNASDILDKLEMEDLLDYLESVDEYEVTNENGKTYNVQVKAETTARRISSLKSFYNFYYRNGYIKNNLASCLKIPKLNKEPKLFMEKSQINRLLNAINDLTGVKESEINKYKLLSTRDYAIMLLLLGTGIRVSELCGINLSDLDLTNQSVRVNRKGGDTDIVYFPSEVKVALEKYINTARMGLYNEDIEKNALFLSYQHKRIADRSVEVLVKKYSEKANLNVNVTPHACRRAYAKNIYDNTGDLFLVSTALNHSSVEVTKNAYSNLTKEQRKIASDVTSNLFNGKDI